MTLDVYNTHMELYPYTKDDYPVIEEMFTAIDKFTGNPKPCGYLIDDGRLFLPRGTPVSKIESICDVKATYIDDSDPIEEMSRNFSPLYDPRNELQEKSIKFLMEEDHQKALNLLMGTGKTFCVAYASTKLCQRTLIITPSESIKQQWIKTYKDMFGYRTKNLINIAGSDIMEAMMLDMITEADVYFVNHQTLQSYMNSTNGYSLHKWFKKMKFGIKVYDESHEHFGNILITDFYSNTNRTWYLTATFDRSDKTESVCFKRAFNSVITFGEFESQAEMIKHVIYHKVNINSQITPKNRAAVIGYQGMTAISYGKYAFLNDPNDTAYKSILEILKKVETVEGKILIFVPLIEAVDTVTKKLKADQDKSVGAYHSKISKDEKDAALNKKDIIVSTIKSCGTGQDIPGLRVVICLEPIASKVVAAQMFGRIRPYYDSKGNLKDTFFFDVCDICIPMINWWWRARYKKIETLAKDTVYLNIDK